MSHVLGIDLGTSATKATLLDREGRAVSASSAPYGFDEPAPEWAEQDPAVWHAGAIEAIARVQAQAGIPASAIEAVGVTGQMHTAVLLDRRGQVLRPPLLWCDQRPVLEAAEMEARMPGLHEITLNPLLPAFTLPKLLWTRAHEPEVDARVERVLQPKDLLRLWLTGELATDPSDAAGTGMFDARRWAWSAPILEAAGIALDRLPPVLPSSAIAGTVTAAAARTFGLAQGTPVVTGAGDQAAQALGLGAVDPGTLVVQVGTSGVIVSPLAEPLDGAFCHAVPGRWIRLDSMHAAGSSLLWAQAAVGDGEDLATLLDAALVAPAGSDGLLFLPFLMGERAGRGTSVPASWVGLRPGHRRPQLVRSVLEGVALELCRMRDRWYGPGEAPTDVRVAGGAARHPAWLQALADAFATPVTFLDRDSSHGAATLAGMALGWWDGPVPPDVTATVAPEPAGSLVMAAAGERYRATYRALAGTDVA